MTKDKMLRDATDAFETIVDTTRRNNIHGDLYDVLIRLASIVSELVKRLPDDPDSLQPNVKPLDKPRLPGW